ncbi:hypothetical protein IT774_13945 [Salinimonas marina]|uniref:Uncharacterized protein n=1 Tax=Salinimonas marina TaxID=2785918 RepID=A0A7S9HCF0_9ALTE|nr:hypothetical protein [Salinimonas marina]QPG05211.1 hypothetical protein IT774_13945 [Salinimonas marina]
MYLLSGNGIHFILDVIVAKKGRLENKMKILIIVFVSILTGCSANNVSRDKTANVAESNQAGFPGNTEEISEMGYPVGTWEGIEQKTGELKVLKLTSSNRHTLATYKIAFGLKLISEIHFDDNAITCGKFDCHILTTTQRGLPYKVSVTQHAGEDFEVVEAKKLKTKEIYSSSYTLKKAAKLTIPEQFHQHASEDVNLNKADYASAWYGFWVGVLEPSGYEDLKVVSLRFLPDELARFTVYTPGLPGRAEMNFNPTDIKQDRGEFITKLEGSLFANELIMRPTIGGIEGSYKLRLPRYPETLTAHGDFRLLKVKER